MYSKVHSYFVPTYFHVQVLLNCIFCFFLRRRRPNPRETRMVNMATSVHRNPRSYAGNTGRFLAHDLATPSAYCRYDHQPRGAGTGKIMDYYFLGLSHRPFQIINLKAVVFL